MHICWALSFLATNTIGATQGLLEGSIIPCFSRVCISVLKNSFEWRASYRVLNDLVHLGLVSCDVPRLFGQAHPVGYP